LVKPFAQAAQAARCSSGTQRLAMQLAATPPSIAHPSPAS
jgi:hypothetical protein